jgi:hypothetical protein
MRHDGTMGDPPLTTAQLNRAVLARQLLLERAPLEPATGLEQVCGLQAQYAPSAYIGLWTRLARFGRDTLTTALNDRSVIQASLMRSTIHVTSQPDFVMMVAGVRRARREWWLRVSRSRGIDEADYRQLAGKLQTMLQDGPRTRSELLAEIESAGFPRHAFEGVVLWLDLVRVPPQGTWEHRRANLFALADKWTDPQMARVDDIDEADGLDYLLRRYLRGFGPAPLSDAASWAGVPVSWLEPSVERLDLRRFSDGGSGVLYDVAHGSLPDPDTPAPVRFLPTWDASLLVHARRAAILPEQHRDAIFNAKNPHSVGTFLVDGTVAGTWRHADGQIQTEPFEPLPAAAAEELEAEAARLAAFHA